MITALLLGFLMTGSSRNVTLPAGTQLQIRLETEVTSEKSSGQAVKGVLIAPVFVDGSIVLESGVEVTGKTADAQAAKAPVDGSAEQPAQLRLTFNKIHDAHHSKSLSSIVESVDNARETVDQSGLIVGIAASQTIEARIDQGIGKLASRNQGLAQILSSVESSFVKKVDPSIDYKPGVEMSLKLTEPLEWDLTGGKDSVGSIAPAAEIVSLVNAEPFRTVAQRPPNPSDLTNLMFLGTFEQLRAAFQAAGWSGAKGLGQDSKLETARALIENRGYQEAPVSLLFLDGKAPDMALQKQNDTFAMRHHIRVWLRPQTFEGRPVWVAAATHDVSITFSPESRNFTHGIDPEIDKERAKVVNDLRFTKLVHAVALVDRSGIPPDPTNATGDKLVTDGKMAVLQF